MHSADFGAIALEKKSDSENGIRQHSNPVRQWPTVIYHAPMKLCGPELRLKKDARRRRNRAILAEELIHFYDLIEVFGFA
jgi:hypothetical protein